MINTINTRIDTARALPIALHRKHGESVLVSIAIFNNGNALKLNDDVTATLFYRSNELEATQWYKASDNVGIDNDAEYSVVNFLWTGKLDNGADFYEWFIQLADDSNLSYSIYGTISLEQSPGFVPNSIKLPVQVLDFSAIEVKNAPYYSQAFLDKELGKIKSDISDIRKDVSGGADASFTAHMDNKDNPHNVTIKQLEKRLASSGTLKVVFDDNPYLSGDFEFNFDPYMFSSGNLKFTLNVGEYAPSSIANKTIVYDDKIHLCESWDTTNNGHPVFVTDSKIDENLYFYVSVIDLKETTTSARLFFLISDKNTATSLSQTTPFGDAIASRVTEFNYAQGGMYQILTDKILRDKTTQKAYTLLVENGELKLQEYRITKFEE